MTGLEIAGLFMVGKGILDMYSGYQQSVNTEKKLKDQAAFYEWQGDQGLKMAALNAGNLTQQTSEHARQVVADGSTKLTFLREKGKRDIREKIAQTGSSGVVVSSIKSQLMTQMLANRLNERNLEQDVAVKANAIRLQGHRNSSLIMAQARIDRTSLYRQGKFATTAASNVASTRGITALSGGLDTASNLFYMDASSRQKGGAGMRTFDWMYS